MAKAPGSRKTAPAAALKTPARRSNKKYSLKLAMEICDRLAAGEVWSRIAGHGRMPSQSALYQWRTNHREFAEMLELAREMAADTAADDVVTVARAVTPATATADRVRIGAMQWAAGKGAPQRYGAKADAAPRGPVRLDIRIRRFEKYTGEDGRLYVREILTEDGE